eukprot:m.226221 g.226221  ORF g.226221 m.226221 type:complete len:93 (+) comp16897_c0_seq1:105-383(+)
MATESYKLQHSSCTGMFWRHDPRGGENVQRGNDNWPRNGSILTGIPHTLPGTKEGPKWLEVVEWQPVGTDKKIAVQGLWMPFEQHGPILYKV